MSRKSVLKSLAFAGLTLSLAAGSAYAQGGKEKEKGKPAEDISTKARNVKPELKEAYKKWLSTDVDYIITKEEKRAFLALQTDEEREMAETLAGRPYTPGGGAYIEGNGQAPKHPQARPLSLRAIAGRLLGG